MLDQEDEGRELKQNKKETIKTAEEFDFRFDEGEDIFDLADIKEEDIHLPEGARIANAMSPEAQSLIKHFESLSKQEKEAVWMWIARNAAETDLWETTAETTSEPSAAC
jgi:hypothetical protein